MFSWIWTFDALSTIIAIFAGQNLLLTCNSS